MRRPIILCAKWGAVPKSTRGLKERPAAGIVIHHTAGPNVEPLHDAIAERVRCLLLARSIQQAHLARGWRDSGHHFLITRSGMILEGRHGTVDVAKQGRVIQGAHAGDNFVNATMWGIECEGLYVEEAPPAEQWAALVDLCAWLCFWGMVQSQEIHGHREFRRTVCPGEQLFQLLPRLRREVHDQKLELMAG